MNDDFDQKAQKKRQKIQVYFWGIVGSAEHISVPKLEDAVRKEFNTKDDRVVQTQIDRMQSEAKIKIENNSKVWIKPPKTKIA
jgi:hypothetical protein